MRYTHVGCSVMCQCMVGATIDHFFAACEALTITTCQSEWYHRTSDIGVTKASGGVRHFCVKQAYHEIDIVHYALIHVALIKVVLIKVIQIKVPKLIPEPRTTQRPRTDHLQPTHPQPTQTINKPPTRNNNYRRPRHTPRPDHPTHHVQTVYRPSAHH